MSRNADDSSVSSPSSAAGLPSSSPRMLWAQHRRTFVIVLVGAVALALLTGAAIFLTVSTQPAEPDPELVGIVAGADAILEERKQQFIDVAIWIGWCVGAFLIGFSAYSELRNRPTGGNQAEAVENGDPRDPD